MLLKSKLNNKVYERVVDHTNSDDTLVVWKAVIEEFASNEAANQERIWNEFSSMPFDNSDVPGFITRLKSMIKKMYEVGITMPLNILSYEILKKLPQTTELTTIATTIKHCRSPLTATLVIHHLKLYANNLISSSKNTKSQVALLTEEVICTKSAHHPKATHPKTQCWKLYPHLNPHRHSNLSKTLEASKPFEELHMDLVGPIAPVSRGGHRYFLTVVGSPTCFVSAISLKRKNDATESIMQAINLKAKRFGYYPTVLHSDRGTEFVNSLLIEFCNLHSIRSRQSNAYTPQQNGLAERFNQTILESVRAVFKDSGLRKDLWNEVVKSCALSLNQIPMHRSKKSPFELFKNRSLPLKYFKPIGIHVSYLILPEVTGSKLSPKGELGRLVGYNDELRSYRILSDTGQLINSNHVQFLNYLSASTTVDSDLDFSLPEEPPDSAVSNTVWNYSKTVWIFKTKPSTPSSAKKKKGRLCIQGFLQVPGQDYGETFAPTGKFTSLLILLMFSLDKKLSIRQFDVKSPFLFAPLEEELYIKTPKGSKQKAPFLRLKKSLYGLKQAPANWYNTLISWFKEISFNQSSADPCLFIHKEKLSFIFFHVDDLVVVGQVGAFEKHFLSRFPNSSPHDPDALPGMELYYDNNSVQLSQKKLIEKGLELAGIQKCRPVKNLR
ncbi:hypothetical protein MJO29_008492 [Puccinia striiformis f. sp. tritici]|nr:hypothetical protein MJO29_008492 [Puccinia striiformis f. sp. tritici]